MQRRHWLAAPALLLGQRATAAADWPLDRPIEVVVPFPAGGATDVMTRLIAAGVAERIPARAAWW